MALRLVVVGESGAALQRARALLGGAFSPQEERLGTPGACQSHLAQSIEMAVERSQTTGAVAAGFAGGLVIPALGYGWAGLLARGGEADALACDELARRLLRRMRDFSGERRACRWSEGVAVAAGGRLVGAWETNSPPERIAHEYAPPADAAAHWTAGLCAPHSADEFARILAPPLRDLLGRLGEADASSVADDETVAFEGGEQSF